MSVFVFDGDDTLWHVEWLYSQAYADFFSYLYKVLGHRAPNLHFIYKVFFAIEEKNAESWGIRRGRPAESMVQAYQSICEWLAKDSGDTIYSAADELAIRKIGDQPFNIDQYSWVLDAEETLAKLAERGHKLCLLTKCDRAIWPEKAEMLKVNRFFKNEHIRTVNTLKRMEDFVGVSHHGDSLPYAVGNGEGDLLPVLENDQWHGFYVPHATSFPLEKDGRPTEVSFEPAAYDHPRVKTLRSIGEILKHV